MSNSPEVQHVIGLMSGTSLDGLDIALCRFQYDGEIWQGEIIDARTVSYPEKLIAQLSESMNLSGKKLCELDNSLGIFCGNAVNEFCSSQQIKAHLIASHGHTVFHDPESRLTVQIGNPAAIAASTKITVVADFRRIDVALGGQGAPLVPYGDQELFSLFPMCLNLGGIANISIKKTKGIVAFDICPVNMILNFLSRKKGKLFDDSGEMATQGMVLPSLLNALNSLAYYGIKPPKSLGKEWFEESFLPLVSKENHSIHDLLRTCVEHIALQISAVVGSETGTMMITGGGAYNSFLIERIRSLSQVEVFIPDSRIIEFKEAYIFAFLGLKRLRGEINTLCSVTGASKDSSGGCIYLP